MAVVDERLQALLEQGEEQGCLNLSAVGEFLQEAELDEEQTTGFFEQSDLSRYRILGSVHPRVVMIAAHDPCIWVVGSWNPDYHVMNGFNVPVRSHSQVDSRRTGSHMVGERQATAPLAGSHWPA